MICGSCKLAGTLNSMANQAISPEVVELLQAEARQHHRECYGDCGCHHYVGDGALNHERIGDGNESSGER